MTTQVVGIDPGLTGGVAICSARGEQCSYEACAMPTVAAPYGGGRAIDGATLWHFLTREIIADKLVICIEGQNPYPKQGVRSCFTLGATVGSLDTIAQLLLDRQWMAELEGAVVYVHPNKWKKWALLIGKPKIASIPIAERLLGFPPLTHGVGDAVLIAQYALDELVPTMESFEVAAEV